ncbi:MAG: SPOR domain-containing protein, partial [Pseudanabaenaceae cyanobacterium]
APAVPVIVQRPQALPPNAPITRPAPPATPAAGNVFRFRVFVPLESEARTAQLRRLVPDAFVTNRNGRRMLQVGAYRDRAEADAQAQRLKEAGFTTTVEGT